MKYLAMASMFEMMAQSSSEDMPRGIMPEFKPSMNYKSKNTGYKNYQFTKDGEFDTKNILNKEIVFRCNAKSDREAIQKFNKYLTEKL